MRTIGSDRDGDAGVQYLYWFLPSLALQIRTGRHGLGAAGTGIVQPTMIVQVLTSF